MRVYISERLARHIRRVMAAIAICVGFVSLMIECRAAGVVNDSDPPPRMTEQREIRSGGVIEESYTYHRQPPNKSVSAPQSVVPASGWYGYGFPVLTFRWGWFGAAHYYPTHFWHDGYYGDCCRYSYRRGY